MLRALEKVYWHDRALKKEKVIKVLRQDTKELKETVKSLQSKLWNDIFRFSNARIEEKSLPNYIFATIFP